MKLQNQTAWSTADLRRFFLAGLNALGARTDKTIRVVYGRGWALHGRATIGWLEEARWIKMTLPGPRVTEACLKLGKPPIDYKRLAQVFEHEVGHNLGLQHRDMQKWWTLQPTWHDGLTIAWEGVKATPLTDDERSRRRETAKERREAHARAMLKKAETRLTRAKTIAARWRDRVTRYEKLAAARPLPATPRTPGVEGADMGNPSSVAQKGS